MTYNQEKIQHIFRNLSDSDLRQVQVELTIEKRNRQLKDVRGFERGQSVSFKATHGRVLNGEVVRVNKKSVTINTPDGKWRVSPSFIIS